jgi:hypothetical protein
MSTMWGPFLRGKKGGRAHAEGQFKGEEGLGGARRNAEKR